MKSINCQNCGAPLSVENHKKSVVCPYCQTENLLSSQGKNTSDSEITVRVVQADTSSKVDSINQLERLHQLYEKGVLSDEEYLKKKEELLSHKENSEPEQVVRNLNNHETISKRSKWTAFIICLFFGVLGAHRFYTGQIGSGFLYLFTGGLFGFGWIIDLIKILTGTYLDNEGRKLKNGTKMPKWVWILIILLLILVIAASLLNLENASTQSSYIINASV